MRRRHHLPELMDWDEDRLIAPTALHNIRCRRCGGGLLDEIHRPPVGWREWLLSLVGLY
jgi:hypothetical protein